MEHLHMTNNDITVSVLDQNQVARTDVEKTIYELEKQIETLASHAD